MLVRIGTAVKGGAVQLWSGLRHRWYYLLMIIAVIGVDQLTKLLAVCYLKPIDTCPLLKGVLHLTYLENSGAAFGMLSNHRAVFMVISSIGIVAFFAYLFGKKEKTLLFDIGLAMVIGGGVGNMIDRIASGYVVDFIDFRLINFAIFNGADSFVCVGAGMIVLSLLLQIVAENKKKDQTTLHDGEEMDKDEHDTDSHS